MKFGFPAVLMVWCWVAPSVAQTFVLPSDFWHVQRNGQTLRAAPQLQQALAAYLQSEQARLRLHHQKRDESIAQVEELRGWLIALGVEAERIELSDDTTADAIKLEIMENR